MKRIFAIEWAAGTHNGKGLVLNLYLYELSIYVSPFRMRPLRLLPGRLSRTVSSLQRMEHTPGIFRLDKLDTVDSFSLNIWNLFNLLPHSCSASQQHFFASMLGPYDTRVRLILFRLYSFSIRGFCTLIHSNADQTWGHEVVAASRWRRMTTPTTVWPQWFFGNSNSHWRISGKAAPGNAMPEQLIVLRRLHCMWIMNHVSSGTRLSGHWHGWFRFIRHNSIVNTEEYEKKKKNTLSSYSEFVRQCMLQTFQRTGKVRFFCWYPVVIKIVCAMCVYTPAVIRWISRTISDATRIAVCDIAEGHL